MRYTHEYYELTIYNPINENTYRVTEKIFNTHEEGLSWLVDEYGWTDALYSGNYIDIENFSRREGFTYASQEEVEAICTQSASDLKKFVNLI